MGTYVVLFRGINVGGKNRVPMAELRSCLEEHGLSNVRSLIASGNLVVTSTKGAAAVRDLVERVLPTRFALDTELVRVLVLTSATFRAVVDDKPPGFGDEPDTFHSDAIFLMGIGVEEALRVFDPRPGIDEIWPGRGVIYSQRLSAERTKSRLNKIVGTAPYQSMTIRNWQTTTRIVDLLDEVEASI